MSQTIAVVLPTCSCSCGCVPRDVEEFLKNQMGYKVISHPIRNPENDFLNAIEETAEAIIQKYAGKTGHILVLCRRMPLTLAALLAVEAGRGGHDLELRVLHQEPMTNQFILVNPLSTLRQMRIMC